MSARLDKWLSKLVDAGSLPTDKEEQRLGKAVLIFLSIIYCILSALWGSAYLALGFPVAAGIPLGYGVLSALTLILFFQTKRYQFFRNTQLTLILLFPFLIQWVLGGFAASSAVMIWSVLAPIGALMFSGTRQAMPWFIAYLLLMAISGIFDIRLLQNAKSLPPIVLDVFFIMNIVGLSSIAFLLIRYFVHERELAMEALGEEHERLGKIKSIMSYFVPETAKSLIEKDPEKALLNKYNRDATVLFLDIEGFTTLLGKYPQERVNRAVEYYFSMFFDIIIKHGGDINETAGDGMMVIFLDTDPHTHAANAVQAALEIQKTCEAYKGVTDPGLFPIQVKIGISSGEVYLGSTKLRGIEGNRWTFTASGPVTVLAARLSEYGRGGQTLLAEETARRIDKAFSLEALGRVPLKNLHDSGEVFRVSGQSA